MVVRVVSWIAAESLSPHAASHIRTLSAGGSAKQKCRDIFVAAFITMQTVALRVIFSQINCRGLARDCPTPNQRKTSRG